MIRITAVIFVLIFCTTSADAQFNTLMMQDADSGVVSLRGGYLSGSNIMTNQLFFDLRKGGYIAPPTFNRLEVMLKNRNIIGGMTFGELNYIHPQRLKIASDTFCMVGGIGMYHFQEAGFTKQAALLTMRGNKRYEGDSLQLAPLIYRNLSYLQYKVGLMKVSSNDKGVSNAGFAIGLATGLSHQLLKIDRATLYTAPFGEYLEMNSSIAFTRSQKGNSGVFHPVGVGPTFDMFYSMIPKRGPAIAVSFSNLGFIVWNHNTQKYNKDTTYRFEGIWIDDIFNIGNNSELTITKDTLGSIFLQYGTSGKDYTSLPLTAHITVEQRLKRLPVVLRGDFIYSLHTIMKPYVSLSIDWHASDRLILSRTYSAGGYYGFANGIWVQWNVSKNWRLDLGSNAIFPFYSQKNTMSIHVSGGLVYRYGAMKKKFVI